ncbi:MAG: type II toxin-antitoxin system VapC family toxin [Nitrospirota bacterium]
MILVDTTVWVDFFRGANSSVNRIFRELIEREDDLCLTPLNLTEILQGIRHDALYQETKEHLLQFPLFHPEGVSTFLHAAEIYRACRRRGRTIRSTIDCVIAAIAIEHDLMVLHRDRDFVHIAACTRLRLFA